MKRILIALAIISSANTGASSQISGDVSIRAIVGGSMIANNGINYVAVVGDNADVGGSVSIDAIVTGGVITKDGVTKIACVDEDTSGSVNISVLTADART